jgi:hypothetical protein
MLCGLLTQASAWADGSRTMAAIAAPSDGAIERLMEKPRPRSEDWLYQSFFSNPDDSIARNYQSAWQYHEIQTQYAPLQTSNAFHAMAALNGPGGRPPLEQDVRVGFAQGVLRLRLDAALKNAVGPVKVPRAARQHLQTVQGGLNKIKNTSVPLSQSQDPARLQIGYDVFTDASKCEVVTSRWGAGIYHARLIGGLSGAAVPTNALSLRFTTTVLPIAATSVSYLPQAKAIEAAFSHPLSRRVMAQFSTSQPLDPAGSSTYAVSFAIGLKN